MLRAVAAGSRCSAYPGSRRIRLRNGGGRALEMALAPGTTDSHVRSHAPERSSSGAAGSARALRRRWQRAPPGPGARSGTPARQRPATKIGSYTPARHRSDRNGLGPCPSPPSSLQLKKCARRVRSRDPRKLLAEAHGSPPLVGGFQALPEPVPTMQRRVRSSVDQRHAPRERDPGDSLRALRHSSRKAPETTVIAANPRASARSPSGRHFTNPLQSAAFQ
jgi:hypothetical protein